LLAQFTFASLSSVSTTPRQILALALELGGDGVKPVGEQR
jgi:hypothetical protein